MKRLLLTGGLAILLFTGPLTGPAQTRNPFQYIRADTTKVISSAELVKMADRVFRQFYTGIYDAKEKAYVDAQLGKLEAPGPDKLKTAGGLSSASVMIAGTGSSKNTAAVFAAKPAALFPKDTIILNNFGAFMRAIDSPKAALKIFLYAKSVCPDAPVILTNLGNTLFELYDDRLAETFFKRALRINPDFAPARQSLVSVYLKRKDGKAAMRELFAGVRSAYCESLGKIHENVKYDHAYQPDQSYGEQSPATPEAPNPAMPVDQLRLPGFPDWADALTLMSDKSVERVSKKLGEISKGAGAKQQAFANTVSKMSPEQLQAWYQHENKSGRILFKKYTLAMELLEEYYNDELDKVFRESGRDDSLHIKKMERALEQLTANDEERAKQMEGNPEAWNKFMTRRCKELKQIREMYYMDWRKTAADRHRKYTDLLMTYWIYCEPYLNRCYDLNEFEKLNDLRKSFVARNMALLYADYKWRQVGFAFQNIGSFANLKGDCPNEKPDDISSSSPDDKVTVPDANADNCPFKNSQAKIGMAFCSIGLDCESIELECTEGLAGAVKWNYKTKEMSVFGGVGVSAKGALGFAEANVEAKTGFEITFNTKGQVTDLAYQSEVSAAAGAGEHEAGQKISMRMSAVSGIDVSRTTEVTYSAF